MRCPVCALEESIIGHAGPQLLGDEELFQRIRVCLGCGLTFAETTPDRDWKSLRGADARAALAIAGDSLEQSPAPLEILARARAVLASSGKLSVRVRDLLAVDLDGFGDAFDLRHRVWFTAETLRGTLAHAGLRAVRVETQDGWLDASAVPAEHEPLRRPRCEPGRSLAHLQSYSRELALRRERISSRLSALLGKRVALFGGGARASELLAFTELGWIASRVVDGDPRSWSTRCVDHVIEPPASLLEDPPEVVVIASEAGREAIESVLAPLAARGIELVRLDELRADQ